MEHIGRLYLPRRVKRLCPRPRTDVPRARATATPARVRLRICYGPAQQGGGPHIVAQQVCARCQVVPNQRRMSRLGVTGGRMLVALVLLVATGIGLALPAQAAACWPAGPRCSDHQLPLGPADPPNPQPGPEQTRAVVTRVDLVWLCTKEGEAARRDFTDEIGRGWCTKAKNGAPMFELVTKTGGDFSFGIRVEINRTSGTGPVTVGPFWAYDRDGPASGEILGKTPSMVKFAEGQTAKIAGFEFSVKCKDPDGDGLLGDGPPDKVNTGLVFGGSQGNEGESHEGDKPWFPFKKPDPAEVNVTAGHDKITNVSSNEFLILCV
jgi:hypothetical protein